MHLRCRQTLIAFTRAMMPRFVLAAAEMAISRLSICRVRLWAGLLLLGFWLAAFSSAALAQTTIATAGKVDPTFGASLGLSRNVSSFLVQPDGKILVIGGTRGIARLNADGTTDYNFSAYANIKGGFSLYLQSDGKIVLYGSFTASFKGGDTRSNIARLNADGTLDTTYKATANGTVNFFFGITAVGNFTAFDGEARNGFANILADGSLAPRTNPYYTSYGGTTIGYINAAIPAFGLLIVGGRFGNMNGVTSISLAAASFDGGYAYPVYPPVSIEYPGFIYGLIQSGDSIIATGQFGYATASQFGIAKFIPGSAPASYGNPAGSALVKDSFQSIIALKTPIDYNSPTKISATPQSDGKIIINGPFVTTDGSARSNLVRLNSTGSLDASFDPGIDGPPDAVYLYPDGKKMIVTGRFTSVKGIPENGIARLNADGTLDRSFDLGSGPDGSIRSLSLQSDGTMILCGQFSAINGMLSNGIARLSATGGLDTNFRADQAPGPNLLVSKSILQPDGKIIITGDFTAYNGTIRNHIARVNVNGSLDTGFNPSTGPDGNITSLLLQPDGKVIIRGNFTKYNNVARDGIARLNTDGSLDAGFDCGANSGGFIASLIVQPDNRVLVQGSFTTFKGFPRNGAARLDSNGNLEGGFNPGANINGTISSLLLQADGKMIITGSFNSFVGNTRNGIARLDSNGNLDTGFVPSVAGPNGLIKSALMQSDNKIVIQGSFTNYNGAARNGFARLNPDGGFDTNYVPGSGLPGGSISAIVMQPDNKILIAGSFASYDGASSNGIVRLDTTGGLDPIFSNAGPVVKDSTKEVRGDLNYLCVQADGKIIVGGTFTNMNDAPRNGFARLLPNGAVDLNFDPGANGLIKDAALQNDTKIIAVGVFTTLSGAVRNYVARLNADGSLDYSFNPAIAGASVTALAVQSSSNVSVSNVIVGGAFTFVGGRSANALARLRPDGTLDTTFTAPFNPGDRVQTFARQAADGKIVASALTSATPLSRSAGGPLPPDADTQVKNPIKRCVPVDGGFDPLFNPNAGTDGVAYSLALQASGKILVAGSFATLSGAAGHLNLGQLTANGYIDQDFIALTDNLVQAVLTQPDGRIVIGGIFTQVSGGSGYQPRFHLARLMENGALDPGFSAAANINGPVAALKLQNDGLLLVGGTFTAANGAARSCLARLRADGTLDTGFSAGAIAFNGGTPLVSSIDVQADGKIVIGGLFDHVGGYVRNKVARLNPDGSVDANFDPGGGPDAIVRALALQPDGKTLIGGDFTVVDTSERNAAARLLGDYDLNQYTALGQWRIINFGLPDATGKAADAASPYGDGVPNLLKYALNMDASRADASTMTAAGTKGLPLLSRDTQGRLSLTFVRRQAATAPGITYSVEFASGLNGSAGFAVNPLATSSAVTIDGAWERVTVLDSVIPSSSQKTRFARLRVSSP